MLCVIADPRQCLKWLIFLKWKHLVHTYTVLIFAFHPCESLLRLIQSCCNCTAIALVSAFFCWRLSHSILRDPLESPCPRFGNHLPCGVLTDPKSHWDECYYITLRAALECQLHPQRGRWSEIKQQSKKIKLHIHEEWSGDTRLWLSHFTKISFSLTLCALAGLHIPHDRYLPNFYNVISSFYEKKKEKDH